MRKPSQDASGGVKFRFRSPTTLHNDPAGMGSILVVFWDCPSFWKMQLNPSGNVKPIDFTRGDSGHVVIPEIFHPLLDGSWIS